VLLWAALGFAGHSQGSPLEERERVAEQIVNVTQLDKLILALAQARLPTDPKFQSKLDYYLYEVRPPALWNEKHPAWAPARAALLVVARENTAHDIKEYWVDLHPLTIRELHSSFTTLPEEEMLRAFVESPGGKAWYERQLAEVRAKNGQTLFEIDPESPAQLAAHAQEARKRFDALPAAEKKRVDEFFAGAKCEKCYRPPAVVIEKFIAGQVGWLVEVLTNMFSPKDYRVADGWKAALDSKLAGILPVDSKKQVLGTLELKPDASLAFRFNFYWNDRADGGALTLEFPRGHPNYAEVLALAPGLAVGKPRQLYRDERGVIGDKP
jgi:hypothetical protein